MPLPAQILPLQHSVPLGSYKGCCAFNLSAFSASPREIGLPLNCACLPAL